MNIIVKNVWKELEVYIEKSLEDSNYDENWTKYVIDPFWNNLCSNAPFDLDERKPYAIKNIEILKKQLELLKKLDMSKLENEMTKIANTLPNFDDDPITVLLLPMDDGNTMVKEKQNGVVGTSLFGNLMIQINPFAADYIKWIPYVFAHEYHHTVWGNYWLALHNGELQGKFIDWLINEGEADSFALSLYPELKPSWIFDSLDHAESMWKDIYKDVWYKEDADYVTYMFGDQEKDIPWCAGYTVGYMLVQKYLQQEHKNIVDILTMKPEKIKEKVDSYIK